MFILLLAIYSFIFNYLRVWQGIFNLYGLFSGAYVANFLIISAFLVVISIAIQVILLNQYDTTTFTVFGVYGGITCLYFSNVPETFDYLLSGTWSWYLFIIADLIWQATSLYVIIGALKKSGNFRLKKDT